MAGPSRLGGLAAMGAFLVALVLLTAPAQGTFPGRNGQIVFEQYGGDTEPLIAIMDPDGSDVRQLTTERGFSPAISPDGEHVVFGEFRECGSRCGGDYLVIMRTDGTDRRALTQFAPDQEDSDASFSPDGKTVVFTRSFVAKSGLWTVGVNGKHAKPLLKERSSEILDDPEFSPNGRKIAFTTARLGRNSGHQISTIRPNGTHRANLTDSRPPTFNGEPSWSPDGEQIAFRRICPKRCKDSDIFVMNADGSDQRRITADKGFQEQPHWSPDGRVVAYVTTTRDNTDIAAKRPFLDARESLITAGTPGTDEEVFDWGPKG